VGLYESFSNALITAIAEGRPGMISAATAATAVLMVTLVKDHGLKYPLPATVLAGLLQIGMGLARLGFVMRYVSKSVMTGFFNALAILIFMAQLPELEPSPEIVVHRDYHHCCCRGLHPQPCHRGAVGRAAVGHLLCGQDCARLPSPMP
jgi:MFS superfamily sulfate permease-like transporter